MKGHFAAIALIVIGAVALGHRRRDERMLEPGDLIAGMAVLEIAQFLQDAIGELLAELHLELGQHLVLLGRAIGHAAELDDTTGVHGDPRGGAFDLLELKLRCATAKGAGRRSDASRRCSRAHGHLETRPVE